MDLIVIDCQYDFIDGTLAAPNGAEAVDKIVNFMNSRDDLRVFYTADFHPEDHMSFVAQGGPWPAHCVAGTRGAEIHEEFATTKYPSDENNLFLKGRNPLEEEYSGFNAENEAGLALKDLVSDHVYLVGIASEYCVRETALAFKQIGKKVIVLSDLLGYIDQEDHFDNLISLKDEGIKILNSDFLTEIRLLANEVYGPSIHYWYEVDLMTNHEYGLIFNTNKYNISDLAKVIKLDLSDYPAYSGNYWYMGKSLEEIVLMVRYHDGLYDVQLNVKDFDFALHWDLIKAWKEELFNELNK